MVTRGRDFDFDFDTDADADSYSLTRCRWFAPRMVMILRNAVGREQSGSHCEQTVNSVRILFRKPDFSVAVRPVILTPTSYEQARSQ